MRLIGLRNICTTKDEWYYLVFYDIDKLALTKEDLEFIDSLDIPYILFKTAHGFHFISLICFDALEWGMLFKTLKVYFKSYYSGTTIRISRKPDEVQKLVRLNSGLFPDTIIPNLYNLYCSRFNLPKMPWTLETTKYNLVFERYNSKKVDNND